MGDNREDLEDRVVDTVRATGSEVVAKPLNVKKYKKKAEASEEEKDKALEENVIDELDNSRADTVRDNDNV
jgi:hypothetical protein